MEKKTEIPKEIGKDSVVLSDNAVKAFNHSKEVIIVDDAGYQLAAETLKSYKEQTKVLVAKEDELKKPLNEARKGIINFFKVPIERLKEAAKAVNDSMIAYHAKVEEGRKEEERKANELAEKERKRQEKLAEKRLETAKKKGDEEKIEKVEEQIEEIQTATVAPVIAARKPVAAGVHTRETWSAEVTNKLGLIKAVAAGKAPETLLDVNMKTANQMARSMKKFLDYPGVKAVSKSSIATRQ